MMKKLKTWQIAIITISTFILALEMIAIINIIRDNYKLELLNVSDWIGSLSTFCTLIVALVAFIKVPDWMNQKHYDLAHKLMNEIIHEDLLKLQMMIPDVRKGMVNLSDIFAKIIKGKEIDEAILQEKQSVVTSNVQAFMLQAASINFKSNKLNTYNFKCTPKMTQSLHVISNHVDVIANNFSELEIVCDEIFLIELMKPEDKVKELDSILKIARSFKVSSQELMKHISSITEAFRPIDEYIEPLKR